MKREEYGGGNGSNHIPQYMYMVYIIPYNQKCLCGKSFEYKIFYVI